jgi:predicted membrane chloride channel (bestrophin family)
MEICGVCERIRNTPLAASYRSLLRCGLSLYILLAPWSVSLEIGWWSIPVLAIGIGLLLGMELTAEAIEEPFGNEGDDLPLDAFCKSIEGFVETVLLHAPDGIWTEPTPSRMHLFQPARPTLAAAADELLLQNSGLLQCSA